MSDRLPYEEELKQQLNDIPLPDENAAWMDMNRKLEDDGNDPIIPFWLNGCGMWTLLALVLIGLGWWLVRPEKWWNKKEVTEFVNINQKENDSNNKNTANLNDSANHSIKEKTVSTAETVVQAPGNTKVDTSLKNMLPPEEKSLVKEKNELPVPETNDDPKKNIKKTIHSGQRVVNSRVQKNKQAESSKDMNRTKEEKSISNRQPAVIIKQPGRDSVGSKTTPATTSKDSLLLADSNVVKTGADKKNPEDSIQVKTESPQANQSKKDSAKKKSIYFAAGLGLHQLLPIDGQKLTPYNSSGRKGSLADYIPSVYFRMYKDEKWFLQSEFRYGAPQYNREFLYNQKIVPDSIGGPISTNTSTKLKKTFYHQLPITFNYFVIKDWSVGAGFVWNKFTSAITEQDVARRNNITMTDSIISKGVIKAEKSDTNFARSYFQAVLETQYSWKRFSFGARYAFGLQPYIKFTLPGGTQQQERNKSLQVFLRYQLWKSKSKPRG